MERVGSPSPRRCFKILGALWAFSYDDEVDDRVQTVIFADSLEAWGWVWLVVGAGVAAITFFPWIYYVPLWTILSVSLAVLVIYALVAYGGRRSDSQDWEYRRG